MTPAIKDAYEMALVMADALEDDARVLTALLYLENFVCVIGDAELSQAEMERLGKTIQGHLLERGPQQMNTDIARLATSVLHRSQKWASPPTGYIDLLDVQRLVHRLWGGDDGK